MMDFLNALQKSWEEAGVSPAMLGIGFVLLLVYFLPALVASGRHHHNAGAIVVLNLFLGWTFLGWVVALVWASTAVDRRREG